MNLCYLGYELQLEYFVMLILVGYSVLAFEVLLSVSGHKHCNVLCKNSMKLSSRWLMTGNSSNSL